MNCTAFVAIATCVLVVQAGAVGKFTVGRSYSRLM